MDTVNDDIFTIPASQQLPPKKYISQRSMMSQSQRSQSQNKQRMARNYFEKILTNCAVVLDNLECYIMGTFNFVMDFVWLFRTKYIVKLGGNGQVNGSTNI